MVWSYPEISLEDLMKLIKNFVDMLILAAGYQSTGRLAHWDSHNIKNSFQWALFLENVSKDLTSSIDYEDAVKELDASLFEITSHPHFPQGLPRLTGRAIGKARDVLLECLIRTLPLRESHFKAIITASVEMDFSSLHRINNNCIEDYIEKLLLIPSESLDLSEGRDFMEDTKILSNAASSGKPGNWDGADFSTLAIQHIRRRQHAVLCASSVEKGLEHIWKTMGQSMDYKLGKTSILEPKNQSGCIIAEELPVESAVWNNWRSQSLQYMLDKRTMRLVSGANLICSAPEAQWIQIFERLQISAGDDKLCQSVELLLLGCIADRWNAIIEHLMSLSYEPVTASRLYQEVFDLPLAKPLNLDLKGSSIISKEKGVLGFLEVLLSGNLNQLWKLSPVLAAAAIPSWSQLFRSYLHELEGQFRGNSFASKCCCCIADEMKHRECEVIERIWCLYIFHSSRFGAAH